MPYTPKTWENKPSTASPINATNLNHMEGGIKTNDDNIVGAQNAILTLQGEMLQAQGDISALETLVDSIFPVDTESGNPAVITDAFGGACKSLKLTLEPIQSGSGTPSPQNVRPISGRTQSVVTRRNRNALPFINETKTQSGLEVAPKSGGRYDFTGTSLANTAIQLTMSVSLSGVYKFVADGYTQTSGSNISLYVQNKGGGGLAAISPNTDIDFDVKEVVSLAFYAGTGAVCNYHDVGFALIPDSATDKSFEPYVTPESITRTYGQTVYGGTDDVTREGATKTKDLYVPVVTTVGYSSSAGTWYADCYGVTIAQDTSTISNMYEQIPHGNVATSGQYKVYTNAFTIYDDRFTTVENAQTILDSCQIVYPPATPTSIPLTAQNITLLHGDNVLTTDADSIEASYSADIALYIDKKIAEGSQGNRSLSKGGSGDEEVKEEVKEEEKKEEIEIKEAEPLTKEVR